MSVLIRDATVITVTAEHPVFAPGAVFVEGNRIADVGPSGALVLCPTQDVYNSRDMLAAVLGLPVEKVRVEASGDGVSVMYDRWAPEGMPTLVVQIQQKKP